MNQPEKQCPKCGGKGYRDVVAQKAKRGQPEIVDRIACACRATK